MSLQSSKPELIPALAGVFKKSFGAFLSPPCPAFSVEHFVGL